MLGRRFTSSRIRKERRQRLFVRILLWIVLAAALLFLIVEIVHIRQLRIERIRFEGNKAVSNEELWEVLRPYVEGDYAYIFSKRNIFIIPNDKIERKLQTTFVRLKDVMIYREGLHTLVVKIAEREPTALWCGEGVTTPTCYYLDENGLAFAEAPSLSGGTFITYARKLPESALGTHLAAPEDFHAIRDFMSSLTTLDFQTERVTWQDDAIVLSVRNSLEEGRIVHVKLKIPLVPPYDKALSNLVSVLQTEGPESEPLSLDGIDYIDIRFENKVFYKKNGSTPTGTEQ